MSRRHGLIAGVMSILLAGSGCMSCGGNGYGLAREAGPDCEALTCQRNQVYVFTISGLNPIEMCATEHFREQLNCKGYAKVGTGQIVHALWMAGEIKRIRCCEPNAAFVIVGVEGGASTAMRLAEKAAADGANVAGVVLFEKKGCNRTAPQGVRLLTVPDNAVSCDESVALVAQLLNEVAATTIQPVVVETAGWEYPHAPEPRPLVAPGHSPEWAFLFDEGIPSRAGTTPVPAIATKPAAQPNTTARK